MSVYQRNGAQPANSVLLGWREVTLYMIYPFHGNVETFFVIQTVPTDWSNLTICANEILDSPHVFSEAHVLKSVHVVHKPVGGQSVPIHWRSCGAEAALFAHGW